MFHQLLMPVMGTLSPSFVVAVLPIVMVLFLLGALRRPAWQASLAGLLVGLAIAIGSWKFPVELALKALAFGATFALWPLMWIVFSALLLYNISVKSGRFVALRDWLVNSLPADRRIVLVVLGFSFSALLEGVAGFGTPIAVTSSLLIMVGFPAIDAIVFTLMFNTAPVAFAALGVPITVLGAVTHLSPQLLGAMVGRQLPFFALLLPFYVTAVYGGIRSVRAIWPLLLVSGGSFALAQFICSNFIDYSLTDVLSSLSSLVITLLFLRLWKPDYDSEFAIPGWDRRQKGTAQISIWRAWSPWLIVSLTVIVWTILGVAKLGAKQIQWPGLHKVVLITLYKSMPYAATWHFEPLGTGTAILLAAGITALVVRLSLTDFILCAVETWQQIRVAVLTVVMIVSLAYLMNYSGMTYTIGLGVSSVGRFFVLLSPFLGWLSVMLSGSDTAGNALFGNLQVVAANQLNLNPILLAAANSSGGVMGKMISPQNLAIGMSVTTLKGKEGVVFTRTFWHSIAFTLLIGGLVAMQQYVVAWMIPR